MRYTDSQRLERMISTARKLLDYIDGNKITQDEILDQEPLRWAITTPLYNIGGQAYNLSDAFKEAHGDIPWNKISGLRHRLVHDYENTNWSLICTILFDVLPGFLSAMEKIQEQARPE